MNDDELMKAFFSSGLLSSDRPVVESDEPLAAVLHQKWMHEDPVEKPSSDEAPLVEEAKTRFSVGDRVVSYAEDSIGTIREVHPSRKSCIVEWDSKPGQRMYYGDVALSPLKDGVEPGVSADGIFWFNAHPDPCGGTIFTADPRSPEKGGFVKFVGYDRNKDGSLDDESHVLYSVTKRNTTISPQMYASIMSSGVIQPVIVRKNGPYAEIVVGRRRVIHLRAVNEALVAEGKEPKLLQMVYASDDQWESLTKIIALGRAMLERSKSE